MHAHPAPALSHASEGEIGTAPFDCPDPHGKAVGGPNIIRIQEGKQRAGARRNSGVPGRSRATIGLGDQKNLAAKALDFRHALVL
jgi:hypothetical protein